MHQRPVLDGIFYVLRTGRKWKAAPPQFGLGSSLHRYFQRWQKRGVFRCGKPSGQGRPIQEQALTLIEQVTMIPTIQCPACHARLKVPEPAPEGPLVCPQCGGTVSLHTEPTVPHRPVPPPPLEESLTKQRLPPTNRATDEDGLMPRPPKPGTEGSNASSIVVHVLAALGIAVISETMLLSYGNSGPVLVLAHMILGGIGVALELNRRPAPKAIGMVIIGFYALIGAGSLVLLALAILMFVICIAARA